MSRSTASVTTGHANRYLQQLSKHWSHKFAVEFDPHHSQIDFGDGRKVDLKATDAALDIEVTSTDESKLPQLQEVVAVHIKRFAFREELDFNWTTSA
jgi:hypothetical protein